MNLHERVLARVKHLAETRAQASLTSAVRGVDSPDLADLVPKVGTTMR